MTDNVANPADNTTGGTMNDYPRRDEHHAATYWTGPVGAPGTKVTGWNRRHGASTTYYTVTCTCREHIYGKPVGEEVYGLSHEDTFARLEQIAYDHAVSHVLTGTN